MVQKSRGARTYWNVGGWSPPIFSRYIFTILSRWRGWGGILFPPHRLVPTKIFDDPKKGYRTREAGGADTLTF